MQVLTTYVSNEPPRSTTTDDVDALSRSWSDDLAGAAATYLMLGGDPAGGAVEMADGTRIVLGATSVADTVASYRRLSISALRGILAGPSSAQAKDCARTVLAERGLRWDYEAACAHAARLYAKGADTTAADAECDRLQALLDL